MEEEKRGGKHDGFVVFMSKIEASKGGEGGELLIEGESCDQMGEGGKRREWKVELVASSEVLEGGEGGERESIFFPKTEMGE